MPALAMLRESRTAIQIITNMSSQVKRLLNEFSENIFAQRIMRHFLNIVAFSAQRLGIVHMFCYTSFIERKE
jgi:hypothetical protein